MLLTLFLFLGSVLIPLAMLWLALRPIQELDEESSSASWEDRPDPLDGWN